MSRSKKSKTKWTIFFCNIIFAFQANAILSDIKAGIELANEASNTLGSSGLDEALDVIEESESLADEMTENENDYLESSESQLKEVTRLMRETNSTKDEVDSVVYDLNLHGKSISQELRTIRRVIRAGKQIRGILRRFKEDKKQTALQRTMVEIEEQQLKNQINTSIFLQNRELRDIKEKLLFKKEIFSSLKAGLKERIEDRGKFNSFVANEAGHFLSMNFTNIVIGLTSLGFGVGCIFVFTGIYYHAGIMILKMSAGFLIASMILPELIQFLKRL
jgi:hypothetical protein